MDDNVIIVPNLLLWNQDDCEGIEQLRIKEEIIMRRQMWVPILGLVVSALALTAGKTGMEKNGFTLPEYHNADAKFLGKHILTSVGEEIRILDLEGNVLKQYGDLSASWIYAEEMPESEDQEGTWTGYAAAYSNHANETHILRLTEEEEILDDRIVLRTDHLAIDPILIRKEDGWFLAHTWIEGTINNPDPDGENGTYTVKLYRSADLENWEYVTDIIRRDKNLEDGDLRYVNGTLYYFFEMEEYDKGPSSICVMSSDDEGESWGEPVELLPPAADNEMASCEPTESGWRLYVSSDYACVGESYQGASVYYADYLPDFTPVSTYRLSAMPDNQAVRLYEVKEIEGKLYFLFARNFLTDCDLLLRTADKEN